MYATSHDTPDRANGSNWLMRILSLPILFGGALAGVAAWGLISAPKGWNFILGGLICGIVSFALLGLGYSLILCRGVPRWFMRLAMIGTVLGLVLPLVGAIFGWLGGQALPPGFSEFVALLVSMFVPFCSSETFCMFWNHKPSGARPE